MIKFISHSIKEALEGIKANKEAYLIAIATTAVSMAIFGIILIVFFNFHELAKTWREKIQIVIYLKDGITKKELNTLKSYFVSSQEIDGYFYISKKEALVKFRKRLNNNQTILDNLNINPLPASFELKLKKNYRNYSKIKNIAGSIRKLGGVESLEFGEGWLERLETILFFLKLIALVVGGMICIGIVFIVSNTIKLSLYARKDEIEIMQLVGANDWFIKGPFLIEGIFQGFLGVILSLALLYGFCKAFIAGLQTSSLFIGFQSFLFIPPMIVFYMILSGILIGFAGSFISLGKFLKK